MSASVQEAVKEQTKTKKRRRWPLVAAALLLFMVGWVAIDLYGPWSVDLRKIDANRMARLETDMWRAYYEKRPFKLYWLLVQLLRGRDGFPFFRANVTAYYAARGAMVFKEGKGRPDYERAIPYLDNYFQSIDKVGELGDNTRKLAELELEWWIVHRERKKYGKPALVDSIANATGAIYGVPPAALREYAQARTDAMCLRDDKAEAGGVTEEDWKRIEEMLLTCYGALAREVKK